MDMAKEVRYGQGWLELGVSQGTPPEEAPPLKPSGEPSVQDHGAYGTDRPYYPEMVSTDRPAEVTAESLQFEISVTEDSLVAAAGTIDGDAISALTQSSPANNTWYLEAKVVINSTTGVVTATSIQWTAGSPSSNTATDYYDVIGEVDVVGGVPDSSSIVQYTYGPMIVVQYGAVSDKWGVLIF